MWLLLFTYAPGKGQWLNARPVHSVRFRTQTVSFSWQYPVLYFLSVKCYNNRQKQHYKVMTKTTLVALSLKAS